MFLGSLWKKETDEEIASKAESIILQLADKFNVRRDLIYDNFPSIVVSHKEADNYDIKNNRITVSNSDSLPEEVAHYIRRVASGTNHIVSGSLEHVVSEAFGEIAYHVLGMHSPAGGSDPYKETVYCASRLYGYMKKSMEQKAVEMMECVQEIDNYLIQHAISAMYKSGINLHKELLEKDPNIIFKSPDEVLSRMDFDRWQMDVGWEEFRKMYELKHG